MSEKEFLSEENVNEGLMQDFQRALGIVDEGDIVEPDDYESSYAVAVDDVMSGKGIPTT